MLTGLREFRKKLSEYTTLVRRGRIVIITDRNKPIASYISPEKLRELAKKANDHIILNELREAEVDKNKEFLESKQNFRKEITYFLTEALEGKGRVPDVVVTKLQTILSTIDNLISDEGTLGDQRMLTLFIQKSHDPMSRVLDYDYYHVHQAFVENVKNEITNMVKATTSGTTKLTISKDIKLLTDMVENAVIRNKKAIDDEVRSTCSILVKITKENEYYSSRIYTIMPYWYEKPRKFNYFLDSSSPLENKLENKRVGDKFQYQKYQFEIISIT